MASAPVDRCPCGPLRAFAGLSDVDRAQAAGPSNRRALCPRSPPAAGQRCLKSHAVLTDTRCGARPGGALNTCGRLVSSPHRHQCSCCRHCTGVFSDLEAIQRSRRGPARMACGCRTLSHGGPGHLGLSDPPEGLERTLSGHRGTTVPAQREHPAVSHFVSSVHQFLFCL